MPVTAEPVTPLDAMDELAGLAQWLCYRLDPPRPGEKPKPRKTPIDPNTGYGAATTDPSTWTTADEAAACYERHPELAGTGFVFTSADPYCGVDLDQCRDKETGQIAPYAQGIIDRLDSYTEVSPSGTGLHIFVRATCPPGGNKRNNVEIYSHSRYFTVTGLHLAGTPIDIRERQDEINALHAEIWGTQEEQARRVTVAARQPADESDSELWERMFRSAKGDRIRRLFEGDTSMHGGDDSGADLALCDHLAFWTGADPGRVDRMFRESALLRDKWDERHGDRTYGQRTIGVACNGKSSTGPALRVIRTNEPGPGPRVDTPATAPPTPQRPASVLDMEPDDERTPIEVPAFPMDVLPGLARQLIEEATAALVCAADLVAVPLLVFAGATMGNRGRLALKRDFIVRPNLFAACVAPPGKSKSPALGAAQLGINALQRRAAATYSADMEQFDADMAAWSKEKNTDRPKPARPEMEAYFSTDCTMEAAAAMLTHSPGFVVVRDELVQWVKSFDAYRAGRGGDRQAWLALWTGQPLKIDRKTTAPIYVTDPCLAVVGGVQPDLLAELREEAGRDDGFIDRLLWSYPETPVHRWSDESVSESTEDGIIGLFQALRSPQQTGTSSRPIPLSPDAQAAFVRWYDSNSRLVEASSGLTAGMYSKLPVQVARLALILHGLALPESYRVEPLSGPVMDGAITLGDYFRAHAHKAIYELSITPTKKGASDMSLANLTVNGTVRRAPGSRGPLPIPTTQRLLAALSDGRWHARIDLFDVLGRNLTSGELTAALEEIGAEHRTQPRPVGRPAEEYRLRTLDSTNEVGN